MKAPIDITNITVAKNFTINDQLPKIFIETYGCQMNVNDSEVVVAIMQQHGFSLTENIKEASLILINTCSIRENAELRIRSRLGDLKIMKKKNPSLTIGVIGCMAERLKEKLLEEEKMVDLIAGPDSYRDLPSLVALAGTGQKAANVLLSREETYADISPVRLDVNKVSAFVSIMRGCNNMCAYCVVPYTRGAERSRNPETILREVAEIVEAGYREVTLLGQNVNSFKWTGVNNEIITFPDLMSMVANINPLLRIRFSTSHPKDLSDELIAVMAKHDNICKSIHLPAQSGSTRILELMKRKYTREWYLDRIKAIKTAMPECTISTDIIAGFCTETEQDHQDTLSLIREVNYDFAYLFKYSERPGTQAERHLKDDVPEKEKSRRLAEIIDIQNKYAFELKKKSIGKIYEVLAEGISKKKNEELFGRSSQNQVIVFPRGNYKPGNYVMVEITHVTPGTLIGKVV